MLISYLACKWILRAGVVVAGTGLVLGGMIYSAVTGCLLASQCDHVSIYPVMTNNRATNHSTESLLLI